MATNIGNLVVNFLANATGFVTGTDKAKKKLTEFQKTTLAVKKSMATLRTGFRLGLAGFGARAVLGQISETINKLDELGDTAEKLAIDPVILGGLRFAAEQTSSSAEAMTTALEILPVQAAKAYGGLTKVRKLFDAIKIDAAELIRLSPDQMLMRVADAIKAMPSQAERMRFATQLFGGEGPSLLPMLQRGSEGIRKFSEQWSESMKDMSDGTMKAVDEAQRALNDLKLSWESLKKSIAIGAWTAFKGQGQMDSGPEFWRWLGEVMSGDWRGEAAALRQIARDVEFENRMQAGIAQPISMDRAGGVQARQIIDQFNQWEAKRKLAEREGVGMMLKWAWSGFGLGRRQQEWDKQDKKWVEGRAFRNPLLETVRSYIQSADDMLKSSASGYQQLLELGNRWQRWELLRPFLPKKAEEKAAETKAARDLADNFALVRGTEEEVVSRQRWEMGLQTMQKQQLVEQKKGNVHLADIARKVGQGAKIVEVKIAG